MPELISVTSETVHATFPELPHLVRLALGFGSKLKHGTLDVTLADGRMVRLGGSGPGPMAAMKIYDYSFASRLLRGGDRLWRGVLYRAASASLQAAVSGGRLSPRSRACRHALRVASERDLSALGPPEERAAGGFRPGCVHGRPPIHPAPAT